MSDVKYERVETKRCPVCRLKGEVFVPEAGMRDWREGMLIQDAMFDVRPEIREQLMTGMHPACWEGLFGDGE